MINGQNNGHFVKYVPCNYGNNWFKVMLVIFVGILLSLCLWPDSVCIGHQKFLKCHQGMGVMILSKGINRMFFIVKPFLRTAQLIKGLHIN